MLSSGRSPERTPGSCPPAVSVRLGFGLGRSTANEKTRGPVLGGRWPWVEILFFGNSDDQDHSAIVYPLRCWRLIIALASASPTKSSLTGSYLSFRFSFMAMLHWWQEVIARWWE